MIILTQSITKEELRVMASSGFGDMVKAVVDVRRDLLAMDAEMHADLETLMLQDGSQQVDLWGINLYPDESDDDFVEFDSLINIRPSQSNPTRGIEDKALQEQIIKILHEWVKP